MIFDYNISCIVGIVYKNHSGVVYNIVRKCETLTWSNKVFIKY